MPSPVKLPRTRKDINMAYLKRNNRGDKKHVDAILAAYKALEELLNSTLGQPLGLLTDEDIDVFNTLVEQHEYELQELWGFNRDRSRHTYWLVNPTCSCPKMDNNDCYGQEVKWYSEYCPWHGWRLDFQEDMLD